MDDEVFNEHVKRLKFNYERVVTHCERIPQMPVLSSPLLNLTNTMVNKFMVDVNEVISSLLDKDVDKEKYEEIKKFEHDVVKARNKL